jgi:hypothetical protein
MPLYKYNRKHVKDMKKKYKILMKNAKKLLNK